ncbi:hypothetical protein [Nocardia carnea]|uniref:hypothetical protein n=1 Tax=Nocardia carnea TaxID=37328 RepID=UPI002454764A|nr:hypothetical protein [Nocardia carnea]
MFTALAEDVRAFAAAEGAVVEFERVAVTENQVRTYRLPTAPAKASDHRSFTGTTTQGGGDSVLQIAACVLAGHLFPTMTLRHPLLARILLPYGPPHSPSSSLRVRVLLEFPPFSLGRFAVLGFRPSGSPPV